MDFLAQQEAARRKSVVLSVLAALSVVPIVLLTACVFEVALWAVYDIILTRDPEYTCQALLSFALENRCGSTVISCIVATLIVVVSGVVSFLEVSSGEAIMKRVGARKARREDEMTFVNVAEEMALAAGADVPSLWVLDSAPDVNAFAAGYANGDAALCVTAGALRHLTRDELQGVVAHEFGHVVNGDMRLNSKLAALVEGLSGISVIGSTMLHLFKGSDEEPEFNWYTRTLRAPSGRSGGLVGPIPLMIVYVLLGASLWCVGLVGKAFAQLFQLAVSREREFLADAAAVQFTRNPEGLANALRFSRKLRDRHWRTYGTASNISHMFFLGEDWFQTKTHPPVNDRIQRISSAGVYANEELFAARLAEVRAERQRKVDENFARYERKRRLDRVLNPKDAPLPPALLAALREVEGAGRILSALLRGEDIPECPNGLTSHAKRVVAARAVAAIQQWGRPEERQAWADRLEAIMIEDGVIDSFELMISCACRRRLLPHAVGQRVDRARQAASAAGVVATVAAFGENPARGYQLARERLRPYLASLPEQPAPYESVSDLRTALADLCSLPPLVKREFLEALKLTVVEDGVISDDEANYLAAVADAIGAYGWKIL